MTRSLFPLLLLVLAIVTGHAAADALTGKQLERELAGHTWVWVSKKFESSGVTSYYRDGRMIVKVDGGNNRPERGRWRVNGDQICVTLAGNRESCSQEIIQVDDDTLYFKVGDANRADYTARGCKAFQPTPGEVSMSYFEVPADVLEDADALRGWATTAVSVARTKAARPRKQSRTRR